MILSALRFVFGLTVIFALQSCAMAPSETAKEWAWETVAAEGEPTARHEASLVAYKGKLYLIGGRRINPVDVYDPATNTWEAKSPTPIELHHFQAVVVGDAIYLIGAMTGGWPNEIPLEQVIAYYPETDTFEFLHEIPEDRRRGGAGAVVHDGKIYLTGGITNGHMDGFKPWLDSYDPATGAWEVLPDAPHARDHFQTVIVDDKLYAFAGRRSRYRTGDSFGLTTNYGNIFDLSTGKWEQVAEATAIPTHRAGNMAIAWGAEVVIGGGESGTQVPAHDEVEAFDTRSNTWRAWPDLQRGRHGSGFAIIDGYLYTASGCGNRGGQPELTSLERIKLPEVSEPSIPAASNRRAVHQKWHTVTLSFEGPQTSETAETNPFTDYRLLVEFEHAETSYKVRGFYAADGNAAESSADAGNIWQVRFAPDRTGDWSYSASLRHGDMVALETDPAAGEAIALTNAHGSFLVEPSAKDGRDFRATGPTIAQDGFFRFAATGKPWLKGGANSPENLLAFADFDGTYRILEGARENESDAGDNLHHYEPHLGDWRLGDPTWQDGKGKGLVGAINYLSSTGMNAAYFLTMNITGDGRDVWPYRAPDDFTCFDVSKLDQWEIVFSHMQAEGVQLHFVTQETENELMLDGGDTGPLRQLYYHELIARFAHHPALIWNLGEENGPVHWMPEGQSHQQRIAMTDFLTANDPYNNPILLHTHAGGPDKDHTLPPLLGYEALDGLSFQVGTRETVNAELRKWLTMADEAGHPWLISMDEIGLWNIGAMADEDDPAHDSLREHVLWATLLGGGAGVEWYFGAHQKGNDLDTEDWRSRDALWRQTAIALDFFETHLPYTEMTPCEGELYCLAKPGRIYAAYIPAGTSAALDLAERDAPYTVSWLDPLAGGELQPGGDASTLAETPDPARDWVVLVK